MGFTTTGTINTGYAATVKEVSDWKDNYKDAHIQKIHDATQMDVVLPDDCLILAGPPRLENNNTSVTPIGFVTSWTMTEQRQVQPFKAIGSRRHVFTATNTPVSLSIERMLIDGPNLLRLLYAQWNSSDTSQSDGFYNSKYIESEWFMNLEDDIYRIPFGIGLIYSNPHALSRVESNKMSAPGADYFEGCVVQSCTMSIQQGQTAIMEQVQITCDRRIPYYGQYRDASTDTSKGLSLND